MSERGWGWLLHGTGTASLLAMLAYYATVVRPSEPLTVAPEFIGHWLIAWVVLIIVAGVPLMGLLKLRERARGRRGAR